jgi:phosphatidylglycerol lysyltransferase
MPGLKEISDEWLASKRTKEKGFSLGRFDERYLKSFPVALIRVGDAVVAFANVWVGADRTEISVDLMRYTSVAPPGVMEFLLIELILWGKENGYQRHGAFVGHREPQSGSALEPGGGSPVQPWRAVLQLPGS